MYRGKNLIRYHQEKYLRIFIIPSIIWVVTGLAGVVAKAPTALSEDDAVFRELKKTAFNFRQVTPDIYRCGLVSKEAAPLLKKLGIKTVLSFDNNLKRVKAEEEFLTPQGIKMVSIPWSGWDQPDEATIEKALALIESPEARPILVHCKHGQERTGVVIACWRIAHEGWTAEKAYQEMKACGFRPFRYGHLKEFVYRFAAAHGDSNAKIGASEQVKTNILSSFYQLRKSKLFPNQSSA